MKLIFVCGSLEPGRDGVGDYTRTLAAELIKQGYKTAALALYEQDLADEIEETQSIDGIDMEVLRVPSYWKQQQRLDRAKNWINRLDPDWLSLQFVPFSFHKKGLPFGLGNQLANLGNGRRWHIMFHELWIGMEKSATQKHIYWGWLQKSIIKTLVSKLQPDIIHTQAPIYQAQLAKIGAPAKYLPLYGNIRFHNMECIRKPERISRNMMSLVLFGGIHPNSPVDEFAKEAAIYSRTKGIEIMLTLIGRSGAEQTRWISAWKSNGLLLTIQGEQTPQNISMSFCNASMGISTTPLALIEKSGSVAAMLEHGLPVICISQHWKARDIEPSKAPSGIFEYVKGNLEQIFSTQERPPMMQKVSQISNTLLEDLMGCHTYNK